MQPPPAACKPSACAAVSHPPSTAADPLLSPCRCGTPSRQRRGTGGRGSRRGRSRRCLPPARVYEGITQGCKVAGGFQGGVEGRGPGEGDTPSAASCRGGGMSCSGCCPERASPSRQPGTTHPPRSSACGSCPARRSAAGTPCAPRRRSPRCSRRSCSGTAPPATCWPGLQRRKEDRRIVLLSINHGCSAPAVGVHWHSLAAGRSPSQV